MKTAKQNKKTSKQQIRQRVKEGKGENEPAQWGYQ